MNILMNLFMTRNLDSRLAWTLGLQYLKILNPVQKTKDMHKLTDEKQNCFTSVLITFYTDLSAWKAFVGGGYNAVSVENQLAHSSFSGTNCTNAKWIRKETGLLQLKPCKPKFC